MKKQHTINLTPKQYLLLKDILVEARAVAQQVSTLCNPSQKKRHLKQAKDIQRLINKVTATTTTTTTDTDTDTDTEGDDNEQHDD